MQKIIFIALVAFMLAGCVSTKKYDAMRAQAMKAERELELVNALATELEAKRDAVQSALDALTIEKTNLESKLASLATEKAGLEKDYSDLSKSYHQMLDDASAETARLLRQLESNQSQLEQNKEELDARLARMNELETALLARDAALENIKNQVSDALLGFEGKGLSISRRDGKVYVSMDDKLLFKSGSYNIDPTGAQAVRDLAAVLAANPDIDIMVEGHTDTVPYRGSGQLRDNLDLSAMRATTITRLLLENEGITPERIVSAGRGEWLPIDTADTAEARQRNRRTEIILTPKLDKLLQITQ